MSIVQIAAYCNRWKLTVKQERAKVVVFSNSPMRDLFLSYDGHVLEQVGSLV